MAAKPPARASPELPFATTPPPGTLLTFETHHLNSQSPDRAGYKPSIMIRPNHYPPKALDPNGCERLVIHSSRPELDPLFLFEAALALN